MDKNYQTADLAGMGCRVKLLMTQILNLKPYTSQNLSSFSLKKDNLKGLNLKKTCHSFDKIIDLLVYLILINEAL